MYLIFSFIFQIFHPDPSVIRQSGFLTPEINGSNVLGSSFTQPYFWKISDSNDLTITPTISDNDFITLQNEYRQANKNSNFLADFGFVKGYISPTTRKKNNFSHFFLNYDVDLQLKNLIPVNYFYLQNKFQMIPI